ncbi:translation initiation factor IF-2, putative [Eimeria necatrix]|uniref:Translation initiation factor IF-2, putative n=1 Tax=Eimeria necatrix TaxID=51315 RepID=U6MFU6_9EIME|nr:translation initiation factor IF-2, putative [Eimeria necatrix]CDJ62911.1 translation initiation factor IF-2, putative [Eimeria necatrix]
MAGTSLYVAEKEEDIAELENEVMQEVSFVLKKVEKTNNGVYVMASTLGALEALLAYLEECKIPVFAVSIGTVQKKDIKKASVMREKGFAEFAVVLGFDVKVDAEAEKEAKTLGVKIFSAEIIYHLFDQFTSYFQQVKQSKKWA